jgi:hypothetical protein
MAQAPTRRVWVARSSSSKNKSPASMERVPQLLEQIGTASQLIVGKCVALSWARLKLNAS